MGTLSRGWQVLPRFGVQIDALYSTHYQALGIATDAQLGEQSVSLNSVLTSAPSGPGVMSTLSVSHSLGDQASLSLNASAQTNGYRDLSDSLLRSDDTPNSKTQYGPTVTWNNQSLGSFSFSWTHSSGGKGENSDYAQLGWTRQIGKGYLSVTAGRNNSGLHNHQQNTIYASWQMPLGKKTTLNTWINHPGNDTRYGSRLTRRESEDTNWNISIEHSQTGKRNSFNAGVNHIAEWSQWSGNVSYDPENYRSISLQGNGSAVFHEHGLLMSPYRTDSTFAVVQTGKQAGVRINTSTGSVRTNTQGYAVVPSLSPWKTSMLQIDTSSLKKHVDVVNALSEISVARGSVRKVDFQIVSARRVLIHVRDAAGQPIAARMGVYDAKNNFITVTGDAGTVFVPDAQLGMVLSVEQSDGQRCHFSLSDLPDQPNEESGLYETMETVCRV